MYVTKWYLPGLLAAGKNTAAASTLCLPIKQIASNMVAQSKDDLMATTLVLGQFFISLLGGEKCRGGVATGLST
jgi:hypothetical protein